MLTPPPRSRQVRSEFSGFLQTLAELDVRSYLEVGAYRGGTFFRVMRSLPPGSFGVTVDDDSRSALRGRASPLAEVGARLGRLGYRIETVFGNSHEPATIAAARALGPFDAVLIDADHRYDAVKRDWEDYGPMGRRLVAFHDIAEEHVTRSGRAVEVPRLWREIRASGAVTREFIAPGSKMGIGVVLRG
ncbi:MAG: class I SAM-dependent methyltransferase [Bauldia sp.]